MTIDRPRPDAVLAFDREGRVVGETRAAAERFPDLRVDRLDDLERALQTLDGAPVRLHAGDTQLARPVGERRALPVRVSVDELVAAGGDDADRLTIVRLADTDGGEETFLQRALGSVLAHHLRTPLTTIYGGAQLMVDPVASEPTKAEAARTVAREAQHLHDIVEDLVVLLRFGQLHSADVEPVLLQHVLPNVIKLERVLRPAATLRADLPPDLPPVIANAGRVQHAFRNLLFNALSYSPAGSTVDVEASHVGEEVVLVVLDDGPLLDDAQARASFDLFARSPRTSADPSGVNLGRFVSRCLLESMGGRTWTEVRSGRMETGFSLPVAEG